MYVYFSDICSNFWSIHSSFVSSRRLFDSSGGMQRSSSAPCLRSRARRSSDREARNRTSRTNGCGGSSPTSWTQLAEIRADLMNTRLFFSPKVLLELWKGHLYCGIWWHPRTPPQSILKPENWHTTLLRCWHPHGARLVFEHHLEAWKDRLSDMMGTMLLPQEDVWGMVAVWLRVPPWRKSWTFGVPEEVLPTCEILQKMLAALCRSISDLSDVHEDEFHISWN